jgi:hypothetical protein
VLIVSDDGSVPRGGVEECKDAPTDSQYFRATLVPTPGSSGEDVERETAAGTEKCDAPEGLEVDWSGCDRSDANLIAAYLSDANLTDASCNNDTLWTDGSTGHGDACPPTNYPPQISAITTLRRPLPQDQAAALGDPARSWGVAKLDPRGGSAERQAGTNGGTSTK